MTSSDPYRTRQCGSLPGAPDGDQFAIIVGSGVLAMRLLFAITLATLTASSVCAALAQAVTDSHSPNHDPSAAYGDPAVSHPAIPGLTEGTTLVITLTGEAQGPGLGDPDGSGTAEILIDAVHGRFCYLLSVENIAPAQLAHIHRSPAGQAGGPIIVQMEAPIDGESERCVPLAPDIASSLLSDPAGYYVNIHNAEHPDGAIRGQLG